MKPCSNDYSNIDDKIASISHKSLDLVDPDRGPLVPRNQGPLGSSLLFTSLVSSPLMFVKSNTVRDQSSSLMNTLLCEFTLEQSYHITTTAVIFLINGTVSMQRENY